MTRSEAVKHERRLRARGVYKPYVTCTNGVMAIESYPLTVMRFKITYRDPRRPGLTITALIAAANKKVATAAATAGHPALTVARVEEFKRRVR